MAPSMTNSGCAGCFMRKRNETIATKSIRELRVLASSRPMSNGRLDREVNRRPIRNTTLSLFGQSQKAVNRRCALERQCRAIGRRHRALGPSHETREGAETECSRGQLKYEGARRPPHTRYVATFLGIDSYCSSGNENGHGFDCTKFTLLFALSSAFLIAS